MSSPTALGLSAGAGCHVPYYLMFNFIYAHGFLSSRTIKQKWKMDHNVSPREDVAKYGEKAVQSGKITQAQLNLLKRHEAAHANRMEHWPVLAAATILSIIAKVPNETVNTASLIYTVSSVAYGLAYIFTTDVKYSYIRSTFWWICNLNVLYLFYISGQALNSK
jgi:uncharacterized MAPEG superfamily protein